MATTTFRDLPSEEDKTLFLVMDGDNNLTGDPKTIDRMLERRETTELRIIRLLASSADSEEYDDSDDENAKPRVKLTVEEILPENADEEGKTGDSTVPPDFVDPLSQLDTEAMLRLKKALASDQAKQILGDNVTAMLDVLSVDENPTVFLQNSIRRDHCYTPLSPSSDPKGASFVTQSNVTEAKRPKGRPPKVEGPRASGSGLSQPNKNPPPPTPSSTASDIEETNDEEYEQSSEDSDSDRDRSSDSDYHDRNSVFGARGRKRGSRGRMRGTGRGGLLKRGRGRPRRERQPSEEPVDEAESPENRVVSTTSPTQPASHSTGKRGRPRKDTSGSSASPKVPVAGTSTAAASVPVVSEVPATPVDIDHAAAKVYSADAIRLGRPTGKSEEERRRDMARILKSLDASGRGRKVIFIQKGTRPAQATVRTEPEPPTTPKHDEKMAELSAPQEGELEKGDTIALRKSGSKPIRTYVRRESGSKELLDVSKASGSEPGQTEQPAPAPSENVMGGKYPRRENRKLPSHLADAVVPELFSVPEALRKRNLGAGVDDASKSKPGGKVVQRSLLRYVRKGSSSPAPIPTDTAEGLIPEQTEKEEVVTEEVVSAPVVDAMAVAVNELQSMLEEGLDDTIVATHNPDKSDSSKVTSKPNPSSDTSRSGQGRTRKISEKELSTRNISVSHRSSGKQGPDSGGRKKDDTISDTSHAVEVPAESVDHLLSVGDELGIAKEDKKLARTGKSSKDGNPSNPGDRHGRTASNEEKNPAVPGARSSKSSKEGKASTETKASQEEAIPDIGGEIEESTSAADERRRNAVKRRRSDEVSDLDSDIDDTLSEASWNSEDDPERLWCICRKPHNNRFMICCDLCEDWFHGKCVGITKSIGKQMEQDGLEWSCPPCTKKKRAEEKEKEVKSTVKISNKGSEMKHTIQTKLSGFQIKRPSSEELPARKCIMCKEPVRENSIYCSDQCIRKHSQRAIAQLSTSTKQDPERPAGGPEPVTAKREERHVIVMDPTSKKVLTGPSAPTVSNLATWLQQNPSFHVLFQKKLTKPGVSGPSVVKGDSVKKIVQLQPASRVPSDTKPTQLKLSVSPNSKQIKIISRAPGQQIIKVIPSGNSRKSQFTTPVKSQSDAAPAPKPRLLEHPRIIERKAVELAKLAKIPERKPVESPRPPQRRRKEKLQVLQDYKSPPSSSAKMEDLKEKEKGSSGGAGEQTIRDSVRKTLGESLKARVADAKDLDVKDKDIDALASKIEERLFKLFENKVDVKYKSKYRSLVFNIKDQKNETLFRKIVENSISPKQLVRLTPDEMASQELAQWREKENQHQLEIIKKTELELMTLGQTFIMKSHKGEEVIEKDQKVAAVAAEIDPNTSAQELVSALNSVSSTTPDAGEAEDVQRDAETSLMKMKKKEKEKERRREKERKRKRDRSRSRGSKHSKSRKRSRSRSRSRDRHRRNRDRKDSKSRSSRHSRDSRDTDRDKEGSKEKKEKQEEEQVEISTSEDVDRKHKEPVSDDADYEPTSTVTIKTPETFPEEPEESEEAVEAASPQSVDSVWSGQIVMAEVAKFHGKALPSAGDCANIHVDVRDKINVVGRIPYETVWEYMGRMKKMTTKDIIVLQIVPMDTDQDRTSFSTLYSYLSKRSRIGVMERTSEHVKDFYLYPYSSDSPVPSVLQPLTVPLSNDRGHILLGIIVRTKRGVRPIAPPALKFSSPKPVSAAPKQTSLPLPPTSPVAPAPSRAKLLPLPESPPEEEGRSYTPPLPEPVVKADPRKRKIRVHVEVAKKPPVVVDDDDAPYSPASSDDDLPPLSKIPKKVQSAPPTKPLPSIPPTEAAALAEAVQIQKKIEEMNRAIEEQTQQIQTLASTVPLLPAIAPALASSLPGVPLSPTTSTVPQLDLALQALQSITPTPVAPTNTQLDLVTTAATSTELDIPLPPSPPPSSQLPESSTGGGEVYSPSGSLSPDQEEASQPPALLLPKVAQISIPSNLQEILASIKQTKPPVPSDLPVSPPASPPASPPLSPPSPPSPPVIHSLSPDPLPQGLEEGEVLLTPSPPKAGKRKPDRKSVFESDGVPEFVGATPKQIKFDLKLKTRDMDERLTPTPGDSRVRDLDERPTILSGRGDQDDRVVTPGDTELRGPLRDRDERSISGPSSDDPVVVEEMRPDGDSARDRDDRILRLSPDNEDDEPVVVGEVHQGRSRTRSTSSDKDERHRRHGRRRSGDSHRQRSERDHERDELEAEWEGSIRHFEEQLSRRNREIRKREIERLRRQSDSDSK